MEIHHPSPLCNTLWVDPYRSSQHPQNCVPNFLNKLSLLHKAVNNLSGKGHVQVSYSNLLLREILTLKQCLKKGISGPCPAKLWVSPQMKTPKPLLFLVPTDNHSHCKKVSLVFCIIWLQTVIFLTLVFQYASLGSEAFPFHPSKEFTSWLQLLNFKTVL